MTAESDVCLHLNEIVDICIVGVEQTDIVIASQLDRQVETPLVLSPLLAAVPQPQVPENTFD